MREETETFKPRPALDTFRFGRDELNLAEFPIAAVADRFLDGTKTVIFRDEVWDNAAKRKLPRELAISGSDRYGLPTAKDEDVLLACVQLASMDDFRSREVHFTRHELLKLLRWDGSTRNYRRLLTSLRRWLGVTIYSDRAFYDHANKSWVNRDFGIFDNLYVYERERGDEQSNARSWFVWNEVVYESFQAGYLKTLDWDLYCRLKDPVAKRLYRFLDKRFYREDRLVIDLNTLAFNKIGVSRKYNTAQVKRAMQKGIRELESLWEIREAAPDRRYRRKGRGQWEAVFERKRKTHTQVKKQEALKNLEFHLHDRGVSAKVACELVRDEPEQKIRAMIELFDWYRSQGQAKNPGFIVAGIRSVEPFIPPVKMVVNKRRKARSRYTNSRSVPQHEIEPANDAQVSAEERRRHEAFQAFWSKLDESNRADFEARALAATDQMKRDGYRRLKPVGGVLFEHYQQLILVELFELTKSSCPLPGQACESSVQSLSAFRSSACQLGKTGDESVDDTVLYI